MVGRPGPGAAEFPSCEPLWGRRRPRVIPTRKGTLSRRSGPWRASWRPSQAATRRSCAAPVSPHGGTDRRRHHPRKRSAFAPKRALSCRYQLTAWVSATQSVHAAPRRGSRPTSPAEPRRCPHPRHPGRAKHLGGTSVAGSQIPRPTERSAPLAPTHSGGSLALPARAAVGPGSRGGPTVFRAPTHRSARLGWPCVAPTSAIHPPATGR